MKLQEFENSYQKSEQKLQFYQKKSNIFCVCYSL